MDIQKMSPNQIRDAGLAVLLKSLGPIGMVRFLQQFGTGTGDYTRERGKWLDKISLTEILATIEAKREEKE
ncbi:MAG: hypothetical protein AB1510_09885 [Bacillota bacterium]